MFARRLLDLAVVLTVAVPITLTRAANAQGVPDCVTGCGGGDDIAPTIQLDAPTGDVYVATPTITLDFCDDQSLNSSTRSIWVNGVLKTTSFNYMVQSPIDCGAEATSTSTTVSLNTGSNTVRGHICDNAGNCGDRTFTVIRRYGPLPLVSLTPYNYDDQDYGRCAASCFAATYSQSTVPYFSLDAPRSVTLVYNGDRVDPKPFVHVDVTHGGNPLNLPSYFTLQVKKADGTFVTFLNGETALRFTADTGARRFGAQFSAATNGMSGMHVYPVTVIVSAAYSGGTETVLNSTNVTVVDEANSGIGRGWGVAGFERIYPQSDGSALIVSGDGSAAYFKWTGTTYTSPPGDFSVLQTGGPSGLSWTRRYPDSTKAYYQSGGNLFEVVDRFGNMTMIVAGTADLQPGTIDGPTNAQFVNDAITLSYGANGLSAITDPLGRATSVTVQSNHTITAIQDPDNVQTTFGYDGTLRLQTVTDRRGGVTGVAYDASSGKLTADTGPAISVWGQQGTARPMTRFGAWQSIGVPYTATASSPFAAVRTDSVKALVVDPGNDTTAVTVDHWGQPVKATDALGRTSATTYNVSGLPVTIQAPSGATEWFDYTSNGLPTYHMLYGRPASHTTYTTDGLPDSTWTDSGTGAKYFSSAGKIDSVRSAGRKYKFWYDARGRRIKTVDPMGHLLGYTWFTDGYSNHFKDSLPGGRITTYAYDTYGRLTSVGQTFVPTRYTTYDVLNRVRTMYTSGNVDTIKYEYDSLFLRAITDPKGQRYQADHDALGRVIRSVDPFGHVDSVAYDIDGNLRQRWNRRGQSLTYSYDRVHRPVVAVGARTDSLVYSADDRVLTAIHVGGPGNWRERVYAGLQGERDSVVDSIAGMRFARFYHYTGVGNLDSVWATSNTGATFNRRHYAWTPTKGTLDSLRLGPDGWTTFGLNADYQTTAITWPGHDTATATYTSLHGIASLISATVSQLVGYDTLGRLNAFLAADSTTGQLYGFDGLGRMVADSFVTLNPATCVYDADYGYDVCSRSGPTWRVDSTHSFSYDPVGNRLDHAASYYPSNSNRLAAFNGCTFAEDNDGNVITRTCGSNTTTYFWSTANQLDSIHIGGGTIRYEYDALGRLMSSSGPEGRRYFLWDGPNLLADLDSTGHLKAEYSYFPGIDNPHAVVWDTVRYYPRTDFQGDVVGLFLDTSAVSGFQYNAWGQSPVDTGQYGIVDEGPSNCFGEWSACAVAMPGWKGALYVKASALYYMRNRWYDPATGRFLSEDPGGLGGSLNLYGFGAGDPINGFDPMGLGPDGGCPPGQIWIEGSGCVFIGRMLPPVVVGPGMYGNGGTSFGDDDRRYMCGLNQQGNQAYCTNNPSTFDQPRPDVGEQAVSQCRSEILLATMNLMLDFATVGMAFEVKGLVRGASLARGEAMSLGSRGLWEAGGRGAWSGYLAKRSAGGLRASVMVADRAFGTNFNAQGEIWASDTPPSFGTFVAGLVPGVDVVKHIGRAISACGGTPTP